MGTTDSKLPKAIDESLPPTERYYGLFNVRLVLPHPLLGLSIPLFSRSFAH